MVSITKNRTALLLILLITSALIAFGFLFRPGSDVSGAEAEPENDPKKNYAVFSLNIPSDVEFAGEKVPVEEVDIRENLDRELLVNTYWQSQTLLFIKRANRFFPVIEPILKKYGVPDDFKYLAVAESGLTNAVSPSNAVGYWQILEGTARENGLEVNAEVDERYHLEKSTEAAAKYLIDSHKKYVNWTMTAASYNAGRKGVDRQVERQKEVNYYDLLLGDETGRYVYRILSFKIIMENPAAYGFFIGSDHLYPQIPYYEVTVDGKVADFADFAKKYGISYKTLKWMNPWLRESFLTNAGGNTYYIRIPKEGYFKMYGTGIIESDSLNINSIK